MATQATRSPCLRRADEIAPLLDRLVELAERELHEPVAVDVQLWGDGDVSLVARHNYGRSVATGRSARAVIKYVPQTEAFVGRYIEQDADGAMVLLEREIETFPAPF